MMTDLLTRTILAEEVAGFIYISLLLGGGGALIIVLLMWHHAKRHLRRELQEIQHENDALARQIEFYEIFFALNGQAFVVWEPQKSVLMMGGKVPEALKFLANPTQIPDLTGWLLPASAHQFMHSIQELESEYQSFDMRFDLIDGRLLAVNGRNIGSCCLLSMSYMGEQEHADARQKIRADELEARLSTLQMLLDEIRHPVWMRDKGAAISWGNRAYFRVSDANYELLSPLVREKIAAAHAKSEPYFAKIPTIIAGDRKILEVSAIQGASGSAGIAIDSTEIVTLREETQRTIADYLAIFDDLPTAVAIFDGAMKLEFFNPAFAALWPLDVAFLESRPSYALLLDRLRENQLLAEQPSWQQWKDELFEAWRMVHSCHYIWNLADGRTLRVMATAGPQGGVAWLYEDLTEKLNLEARYNTLIRMQGAMLDHLHEGVALFGSDGRLRLANPAFGHLWNLPAQLAIDGVHISRLEAFCSPLCVADDWHIIAAFITGFTDMREARSARTELQDGRVVDYMLVPLPQGQSMLSFIDISDSVRVERALKERNDALESVNELRTDFISHVSYELRTPLTNIIGFSDLLRSPAFGTLNDQQIDYLNNIATQSNELLNLVNDILDLATIDAGIMQLDIGEIDIAATMRFAALRIEEKLETRKITLQLQIDEGLPHFHGDEIRVRQVLFNLLSNAANFAPIGSTIGFSVQAGQDEVIFRVQDSGSGIPANILDRVFERFCAKAHHGSRPGAGLGLSIVKSFCELHNGYVEIETSQERGTTISCHFPVAPAQT